MNILINFVRVDTVKTLTVKVTDEENGKVIPVIIGPEVFSRELLAPHAPLALILTFVIVIGGVWYVYCYVV